MGKNINIEFCHRLTARRIHTNTYYLTETARPSYGKKLVQNTHIYWCVDTCERDNRQEPKKKRWKKRRKNRNASN